MPCCADLSAALFAPAWVWEVGNRADWLQRQHHFWDKIQACCQLPRALVVQLPFSSCFDQGAGLARYSEVSFVFDAIQTNAKHLGTEGLGPCSHCSFVLNVRKATLRSDLKVFVRP